MLNISGPKSSSSIVVFVVFDDFLCLSLFGEMIQFDEHIFQKGWFNHQLEKMFLFWFDFGTFLWNVLSWYKHAFVLYFNHKNNRLFVLVCVCVQRHS